MINKLRLDCFKIIFLFFIIPTFSKIFGQNLSAYHDRKSIGAGSSYNVTVSVTKIERNSALNSGGWEIKLVSVTPDSKGYFFEYNGKSRYYSYAELGNVCNPQKFEEVTVGVSFQCNNSGTQNLTFRNIGAIQKVIVRQDANKACIIKLSGVIVKINAFDKLNIEKKIKELNVTSTAKPNSNSNNNQSQNSYNGKSSSNSKNNITSENLKVIELDPQLEELISNYHQAINSSNNNQASKIRAEILEIANHAYPDKIDDIMKLIAVPEKKIISKENINLLKNNKSENDSFSEWKFLQSDKAIQVRYQEVKNDGSIAYFKVQFRINFNDEIFCRNQDCLGYLFVYGYPTLDGKEYVEKSYKFYNTYKEVYTVPDLIPIQMSFSDGSKRTFNKNGFFYINNDNKEIPLPYLFSVCVDDILKSNPNYHRCKRFTFFKENEIITIQ